MASGVSSGEDETVSDKDKIKAMRARQKQTDAQIANLTKLVESQTTQLAAAQSTSQANTAPVIQNPAAGPGNSGMSAKVSIETPKLKPNMDFHTYKFEVNLWLRTAKLTVQENALGLILLSGMPADDDKMIKKTVVGRLGDDIEKPGAVDKIMEIVKEMLELQPFPRLINWQEKFNKIEQGSSSYEKYSLKLMHLFNEAETDFDLHIPAMMRVAKLLIGCSQVNGSNVNIITSGITLDKSNATLYQDVEKALKSYLSTTRAFDVQKPHKVMAAATLDTEELSDKERFVRKNMDKMTDTSSDTDQDSDSIRTFAAWKKKKKRQKATRAYHQAEAGKVKEGYEEKVSR